MVNYGLTKKMLAVQGEAYKKQYGLDSIHLILTNLYGPGDSYNPERSHVVAALVRKWVEAEMAKAARDRGLGHRQAGPRVHLRRGLRRRDRAGRREVQRCDLPLNIGTGIGTSIRELVETINAVTGYRGQDRLERRQARRRDDEGARRRPG